MTTIEAAGMAWAGARAAKRARPPRTPLTVRAARTLGRLLPTWAKVRSTVMQLAGFGFLDWAAWRWDMTAGLIAIGVSLFAIEALSGAEPRRR